jgi:T5SS/PEP-CTERM-associated repeat protein
MRRVSSKTAAAGILVLAQQNGAGAQDLFYSLEGAFTSSADEHRFFVSVPAGLASFDETRFLTWHHGGGTNLAGDAIAAGSFDPKLRLLDSGGALVAANDDRFTGFILDAQIVAPGLAEDTYELIMDVQSGAVGGPWALDLLGDAGTEIKLRADDTAGSGSTIGSLKFGSRNAGTAQIRVADGASLTVNGAISVAHIGFDGLPSSANLTSSSGGQVSAVDVDIAPGPGSTSALSLITGIGSILDVSNNFTVGQTGSAQFLILNDAVVTVADQATVGSGGTLRLQDGTLRAGTLHHSSGGIFTITGGASRPERSTAT